MTVLSDRPHVEIGLLQDLQLLCLHGCNWPHVVVRVMVSSSVALCMYVSEEDEYCAMPTHAAFIMHTIWLSKIRCYVSSCYHCLDRIHEQLLLYA
jgi:hypothetical protein